MQTAQPKKIGWAGNNGYDGAIALCQALVGPSDEDDLDSDMNNDVGFRRRPGESRSDTAIPRGTRRRTAPQRGAQADERAVDGGALHRRQAPPEVHRLRRQHDRSVGQHVAPAFPDRLDAVHEHVAHAGGVAMRLLVRGRIDERGFGVGDVKRFQRCGAFGDYPEDAMSVFMRKIL